MTHFGWKFATRLILALSLQLAGSSTMAGGSCDGDLSQWPSELTYLPTLELHEGAVLRLGPMTTSGLATYSGSVAISESTIAITGWWEDACGFDPRTWGYSDVDIPQLAPGVYTVNFDVVGFPGADQFTRTLIVSGAVAQAPVPMPAVSGYSLAMGILGILVLAGWMVRGDRTRPRRVQ